LIVIHCSAVGPGQTSSAKQIDSWHRKRGFDGIGYHYVIRRDGSVEKGRPEAKIGAHAKGYNAHSIGICYEGGLRPPDPTFCPSTKVEGENKQRDSKKKYVAADTRTPEQKEAILKLLRELMERYPGCKVVGHRDLGAKKSCPCFDAIAEYGPPNPL